MKKSTRKTIFMMATLVLSLTAVGMVNLNWETASADTTLPNVSMVSGASIRLGASESKNGMRFSMKMDKSEYETMMSDTKYTDVEFGVIIAPNEAGYTDISYDTVFGDSESKKYDWATWDDETNKWVYTGTDTDAYTQIMLYSFDKMYVYASANTWESEDEVYVRGTISNVQNETREFQGIGYVTYKYNGEQKHVFLAPQLRSMTHVAQMAAENNPSASADLVAMYITDYAKGGVKATKTSFTEEYYFEQADGTYQLDESETKTVTQYNDDDVYIHDEVTAAKPHFDGYVFNSTHEDNVAMGHAYANDKLVLKRYYKQLDPSKLEGSYTNVIADNSNYTDNWYNSTNPVFDVGISAYEGEAVTDSKGVTYTPATVFSLTGQNANQNVGPLFGFYNEIEKSDLEELRAEGYEFLTFAVKLNATTTKYPRLRVLDFAKMRELRDAGTTFNRQALSKVLPVDDKAEINHNWGIVYYALDDLIEFHDVLFTEGTAVPLAQPYIWQASWSEAYTYYLTNFSLIKTVDLSQLTTYGNTYYGSDSNPVNGINSITGTAYTGEAITDSNDLTLMPHTVFEGAAKTESPKNYYVLQLRSVKNSMSKQVLQQLYAAGKTKFVFYVYRTTDVPWDLIKYTLKTADLAAYYTQNAAMPSFNGTMKTYMTSETINSGCNQWIKYEYSLEDMITLYDAFWTSPGQWSWPLARFGCWSTEGGPIYISEFFVE